MRVYGRVTNQDGSSTWAIVTTSANGTNDFVYLTALAQVLLLNLGESPFYANFGIPAHPSVVTQVFPDYYMSYTQQIYSRYFANLIVSKVAVPTPTYNVNVTTHAGVRLNASIPIPV